MAMTAEMSDLSIRLRTPEAVAGLIRHLDSDVRHTPAVIVSPRHATPAYGVSPPRLAEQLAGRAEVYVIDTPRLSWELESHPKHRTWGGAVRVTAADDWSVVIRTDIDAADALERILDAVGEAEKRMGEPTAVHLDQGLPRVSRPCRVTPGDLARRAHPESAGAAPAPTDETSASTPSTVVDDSRHDQVAAELARVSGELDQERVRRSAAEDAAARAQSEVESLTAEVACESELRRRAEERVAQLRDALSTARDKASTAQKRVEALAAELDAEHAPLFSDPDTQLRDDVQRTWLRAVTEPERGKYPLRDFRVGENFIESLDMPLAPRSKIIAVVVDVLTRRAHEMASRSVHLHGDGRNAGAGGQMVRGDGAVAYRCDIRSNTPSAPRLLWWELVDGTVELALAARHDDPMP